MAIHLGWGRLRLKTFGCSVADQAKIGGVRGRITSVDTDPSMDFTLNPSYKISGKELTVTFENELNLQAGQTLEIEVES